MPTYELKFSVLASFSGEHPMLSEYWPCETTLNDVIQAWPGDKPEPSDPYDSEYDYLAREGGIPRPILDRLAEVDSPVKFQICRKLKERFPREAFWACISDIQVSGLFDRKTLFGFLDSIGAGFETENTMGTLGGPLGWHVPDVAYYVESQALVSSIRITPILCKDGEPVRAPSEEQWNRLVEIFKNTSCYRLARTGARC